MQIFSELNFTKLFNVESSIGLEVEWCRSYRIKESKAYFLLAPNPSTL
jgi:hypothetical protein